MKYILTFSIVFLLSGCGLDNDYFLYRNYERQPLTATIGNPMMSTTIEYKNNVYQTILDRFQWELIYSGKSANVIKIIYREYSKDMARQAFSQELQYDLNESKIIKFKNTTIEVISATNQEINYRVIDSPSLQYKQGKLTREDIESMKGKNQGN